MIAFRLDELSGIAPYQQLVNQVRNAMLLGRLVQGDRLPTVKAVATMLAINPNTVLKAYRELDYSGLITAQNGVGTLHLSHPPRQRLPRRTRNPARGPDPMAGGRPRGRHERRGRPRHIHDDIQRAVSRLARCQQVRLERRSHRGHVHYDNQRTVMRAGRTFPSR